MSDPIQITKADAVEAYGGNQAALAHALGLTRQAVSAWPDGPIAEGYALKLRFVLKPDAFPASQCAEPASEPLARAG